MKYTLEHKLELLKVEMEQLDCSLAVYQEKSEDNYSGVAYDILLNITQDKIESVGAQIVLIEAILGSDNNVN